MPGAGALSRNRPSYSDTPLETPASLLERLRRPADAKAWGRFVELYTPLLYCWARRWGLQEADAADLVQDVLTLLFQKLPEFTYDRHKSFRGWLHTVALNKWRERQRRRATANLPGSGGLSGVPDADDPGEVDEAEYCRHLVQQALGALRDEFPARTWKAFELHVMAGRRAGEAAAEMGVRVSTIYAAKSRVLSRLRQELDGLLD